MTGREPFKPVIGILLTKEELLFIKCRCVTSVVFYTILPGSSVGSLPELTHVSARERVVRICIMCMLCKASQMVSYIRDIPLMWKREYEFIIKGK